MVNFWNFKEVDLFAFTFLAFLSSGFLKVSDSAILEVALGFNGAYLRAIKAKFNIKQDLT